MPRLPRLPMVDLTPLRTSRDFRLLLVAGTVTYLGAMVTYVALPWQLYSLTRSNLAVGMLGAVELVPLVVFGLWGGAIADHYDRRTVLVTTTVGQVALTALLLVNAHLPTPQVWALYVVGALLSAVTAAHRPSREALLPRVVRHDELPGRLALSSIGMQTGLLAGPAIGGLILATGRRDMGVRGRRRGPAPSRRRCTSACGRPPSRTAGRRRASRASSRDPLRGRTARPARHLRRSTWSRCSSRCRPCSSPRSPPTCSGSPSCSACSTARGRRAAWSRQRRAAGRSRVHHHGRVVVVAAACWGLATAAAGLASSRLARAACSSPSPGRPTW